MTSYIDFNTERRKEAINEADKNHFKLLNNAVYGKTMENMRKRIKIRVVKNAKDFIKYTSRPTCVNWQKNLAAIHEKKRSLILNKPIYVGFTLLELSNTKLLFTDTDSLCYECDEDPREKTYKHKELFDLNNFPVSSKYYCNNNKKVLSKMKDEYGGKSILKFVGLKSKISSILDQSNNEKSTSKGHNVLIEFREFYNTLFKKKIIRHTMTGIKSKTSKILAYMKLIKDLYHVLMIIDIFLKMELIH